jgi:hypothetical protein
VQGYDPKVGYRIGKGNGPIGSLLND